jgi:hypothetical protein
MLIYTGPALVLSASSTRVILAPLPLKRFKHITKKRRIVGAGGAKLHP